MSDIEMEQGEEIVKEAGAVSTQSPRPIGADSRFRFSMPEFIGNGRVYLTSKRLIWRRQRFSMPLTVRSFDIRLTDIRDCKLAGSGLTMFFYVGGLRIITDTQKHFLIVKPPRWPPTLGYSKKVQEEWRDAILNAATPNTS